MSNDGSLILFLANDEKGTAQAYLIKSDGTGLRALTDNYAGIQNAILSGDGTACYVVTNAGRIFWLSLTTGASRQVVGRTPVAGYATPGSIASPGDLSIPPSWTAFSAGAPGMLLSMSGAGLAELRRTANSLPLPETLSGFRIIYNGTALPVRRTGPDEVQIQLPWACRETSSTRPL